MDTDRWHCWGYTDHQGTLIINALMITDHMSKHLWLFPLIGDPLCPRD
ncbi:unnamed protein product, partial [Staurois parvus]